MAKIVLSTALHELIELTTEHEKTIKLLTEAIENRILGQDSDDDFHLAVELEIKAWSKISGFADDNWRLLNKDSETPLPSLGTISTESND